MADKSHGKHRTIFLALVQPEAAPLGLWLRDIVEANLMPPVERAVLYNVTTVSDAAKADGEASDHGGNGCFHTALIRALNEFSRDDTHSAEAKAVRVLVVVLFWDGQSEWAKAEFIRLRELADEWSRGGGGASQGDGEDGVPRSGGTSNNQEATGNSDIQLVLQALNAKKSNEKLMETQGAVLSTLRKKLQLISGIPEHMDPARDITAAPRGGERTAATDGDKDVRHVTNEDANGGSAIGVEDLSDSAICRRLDEGQGECFIVISGPTVEEFQKRVAQLKAAAEHIGVGCSPVLTEPREVQTNSNGTKMKVLAQEFLVRQSVSVEEHIEMRIAMCGNVDSGKSTLTSVLTRGCRDNGRGSARAFVFKHKHEAATGRTSSVSENHLGFSAVGEVVNYMLAGAKQGPSGESVAGGTTDGAAGNKPLTIHAHQLAQEVVTRSAKVLTLYDLAGHEKYLKTTVLGMTRNIPDYGCVVISANNGIQRMTKEHLALCLALKIPFFIVVTRIDSTPENIRQETLANIHKLLKVPTVRKLPYPVRRVDDVVLSAKNLRNDRIAPIFEVSNVSGEGLQSLVRFLNLLPMRKDWRNARQLPREMVIDSTFFVTGVGTVVGGIVTQGIFNVNDTVLLGPDSNGAFRPVQIKSIHVKGVEQRRAVAGCDASFCLKREKRRGIRKGNILTDPRHPVEAYWQFEADVVILYHSTTILVNYEPVIHSTTVRQSARIVFVEKEVLRTGDRSLVRFHFLYRPEFMKVGQQLIFREGRTKGIGTVTRLINQREESLLLKNLKKREA